MQKEISLSLTRTHTPYTLSKALSNWKQRLEWCACMCAQSLQLFATPWTVALQTSLSMGLSQQEYWSGLPFPPLGLSDKSKNGHVNWKLEKAKNEFYSRIHREYNPTDILILVRWYCYWPSGLQNCKRINLIVWSYPSVWQCVTTATGT